MAFALCLGSQLANAGMISNEIIENFNELGPSESITTAGAFYTINGTNVDAIGGASLDPSVNYFAGICGAPQSLTCIDLNGTVNAPGNSSQGQLQAAFLGLAPANYTLSFDLIGAGGAAYGRNVTTSTTVTFGGASCTSSSTATCMYNQTFTLGSTDVTDGIVLEFPLTIAQPGDFFLTFTSNTSGYVGALLDNVVFVDPSDPVPEPSTVSLLGAALLILLPRLRRRLAAV
jgi:hypothetical protein